MLKTFYGMVTQTIADSERFTIDFSFYKQRRVNFVGFFLDSLCLSFIAEQKKNEKGIVKGRMHTVSFCLYLDILLFSSARRNHNFLSH